MARRRRRTNGLPVVDDVEKFLDKLTASVEDFGETLVSWLQGAIGWLRRHKKLAIAVLVLVIAYHWLSSAPNGEEEEE